MSTPSLPTISLLNIEEYGEPLVSAKNTKQYSGNSNIKKSTEKTLCCKIKRVLVCFVAVAMYVGIGMLWAMKHFGTTSLLVVTTPPYEGISPASAI